MSESCKTCRFWKHDGWTPGNKGVCRRYPQQQAKDGEDWCGEYQFGGVYSTTVSDAFNDVAIVKGNQ